MRFGATVEPEDGVSERILWRSSLAAESSGGWEVARRAFPWISLARDLVPALWDD